jgi:hypothetical protein
MHTMTERKAKSGTIDMKALLKGDEEFPPSVGADGTPGGARSGDD